MLAVKINNLSYQINNNDILQNVNLELEQDKIACVLGPSGCGKTTMLKLIAGLDKVQSGEIYLHDNLVSSINKHIKTEKRKIGFLFQDYALFPHLTVKENLIFWAKIFGHGTGVDAALDQFGISNHSEVPASYLSEGQRRRLTLARLALDQPISALPSLWLLDEPTWGLDPEAVKTLSNLAIDHVKNQGMAIISTHGSILDKYLASSSDRYSLTENIF